MGGAKLHSLLRFRMSSHLLQIGQGRHFRLPLHRRVCRLFSTRFLVRIQTTGRAANREISRSFDSIFLYR